MPFTAGLKPTSRKPNQNLKENASTEIKGALIAVTLVASFLAIAGYAADEYLKSKISGNDVNPIPTPTQVTRTPIPSPTPSQLIRPKIGR